MNRLTRTCLFFLLLSMSSCSNATKTLSKVKIEKDIDLSTKIDQALTTGDFQKGFWPEERWWEMFEDEQLSSFIDIALESSPSLKATEARVRQANQEAFITRSKLFPNLSGLFNYVYSYLSEKGLNKHFKGLNPNFNLFALMLDFSYEFDFWKKNRNAYEAALGQAQTQSALNQQNKMVLSISIAGQYYNLQSNMAKMAVLQEILENKSKLYRLTELRRVNRISNLIDLNEIKQEIFALQEALAGLTGELKLQKNTLITLMGRNPATDLKIKASWDVPNRPFELPDKIGLGLLARRPDLMSQVWSVYSATRNVGVAVAEFLPDVTLNAFGGTDAIKFQDLFSKNSGAVTALPLVTQQIFNAGRLRGNLKAKVAAYEIAVHNYNETLLQAANDVVSGIVNINTSAEKFQYQSEEVATKKDTYSLVYTRYKHGIDSMMKVLMTDDDYLKCRYNQIDLSNDRIQAAIDLVRALGGGYHSEMAEKDKEIKKL